MMQISTHHNQNEETKATKKTEIFQLTTQYKKNREQNEGEIKQLITHCEELKSQYQKDKAEKEED